MKKFSLVIVFAFVALFIGVLSVNAQRSGPLPVPLFQDPVPPQPQPQPKPQQPAPQPQPRPEANQQWWQRFVPNGGSFFQNIFPWWQPQGNPKPQPQQNTNPQQNNNGGNWAPLPQGQGNQNPPQPQGQGNRNQPQPQPQGQGQQPPQWQQGPNPQQGGPQGIPNNRSVQVSTTWAGDRTLNLTWTITNNTNAPWPSSNVDILCAGGTELLTNPKRTRWDIPYTVQRGGQLTFTVNIYQPAPGQMMIFKLMDGGKTLYSFEVRP